MCWGQGAFWLRVGMTLMGLSFACLAVFSLCFRHLCRPGAAAAGASPPHPRAAEPGAADDAASRGGGRLEVVIEAGGLQAEQQRDTHDGSAAKVMLVQMCRSSCCVAHVFVMLCDMCVRNAAARGGGWRRRPEVGRTGEQENVRVRVGVRLQRVL